MTSQLRKKSAAGQLSEVNKIINNTDDYYTQVYYMKSIEKGRETFKGAFMSVNKNSKPNVPDSFDDKVYYTNNAIDRSINQIPYDNTNLIKMVFMGFIIAFLCFILYDFHTVYSSLKKDNEIERQKLINEYESNKCSQVIIDDGPELNRFCVETRKKIENQTVYFHVAIIAYIKSIFSHSFSNLSLINSALFLIVTLFLVKYITH